MFIQRLSQPAGNKTGLRPRDVKLQNRKKSLLQVLFILTQNISKEVQAQNGTALRPGRQTGTPNGQPESFTVESKAGRLRAEKTLPQSERAAGRNNRSLA